MPLIAFRCSKNCYVHLVTCTSKETHTSFNTKMHDSTLNVCCWRQFQNMTEVLSHPHDSLELGPPDYHPFRTLKDYTNSRIVTGILWKSGRTFPLTENSIGEYLLLLHMSIHFNVMQTWSLLLVWSYNSRRCLSSWVFCKQTSETATTSIPLTSNIISDDDDDNDIVKNISHH